MGGTYPQGTHVHRVYLKMVAIARRVRELRLEVPVKKPKTVHL